MRRTLALRYRHCCPARKPPPSCAAVCSIRTDTNGNKAELTRTVQKIRAALSKEARAANDSTIARHIIELSLYKDAKRLWPHCAIGSEASIQAVITHALSRGKTVLLPVTDPVTQTMLPHSLPQPAIWRAAATVSMSQRTRALIAVRLTCACAGSCVRQKRAKD